MVAKRLSQAALPVLTLMALLYLDGNVVSGRHDQPDVSITLNNVSYANNSVINLTDIGEASSGLICQTPYNIECCGEPENPDVSPLGNWYLPNGSVVLNEGMDQDIYILRGAGEVTLNRRNNATSPTGIYRCEIPRFARGYNRNLFVGVYNNGNQGVPSIQSIQFDLTNTLFNLIINRVIPSFTLDCITAGGPVSFYDIAWTRDGSSLPANRGFSQVLDDGSTATYNNTLAVTGREPGRYRCQLLLPGSSTFMDITVRAANTPTNVMAKQSGPNNITVTWNPPVANGVTIICYALVLDSLNGYSALVGSVHDDVSETSYTLNDIPYGALYNVSVVAVSDQLPSALSDPVQLTLVIPGPSNLASPSQTPTSIALSWDLPVGLFYGFSIDYTYQGGCSDYFQRFNHTTVSNRTATEFTLQFLQEFSDYTISVTPSRFGNSVASTIMATTAPSAPSGPPESVRTSLVTFSSITVRWDPVSCIDRNSEITGYIVRYAQTGNTTTVSESVSGTSDSDRRFTASGLVPRTSYTFEVAAVSSEGTGPFSTAITVKAVYTTAIAGGVVAAVIVLGVLATAILILCMLKHRQSKRSQTYEDAVATHSKSTTTASTEAYISLPTQSHDDDPSEVKYADP